MNASTRLIAIISVYTLYLPCRSTTSEDQFNSQQSHGDNIFRVRYVYRFCSSTKPNEYRNRTQDILIPVNSFTPPLGFCAQLLVYCAMYTMRFCHLICMNVFQAIRTCGFWKEHNTLFNSKRLVKIDSFDTILYHACCCIARIRPNIVWTR